MKIGTDVSLSVCRCEGYLVAEFSPRKLFNKGKLDPDYTIHFTRSNPSQWYDNGYLRIGSDNAYYLDEYLSYGDILSEYLMDRQAIDSYMGNDDPDNYIDYTDLDSIKTIYDILNFADNVDSYRGLATK